MELKKQLENFILQKKLLSKSEKVLLAVSGGVDSVVMAELFFRNKFRFGIAHCNFQLRGDESDADEMFVSRLAARYKVPFHSIRFDTADLALKNKLSIQETARKLRYDWFAEILSSDHYAKVATAHHLNDSIETFFINLLRGTGISGLRGIQPFNEASKTIRPLLFAPKSVLEAFAEEERISFRLDHSNETDLYLRNRLRHHLIPVLLQLNPQFEKVMERNLTNLAFAESILNERIQKEFLSGFDKSNPDDTLMISRKALSGSGFPKEMLQAVIQPFGFNSSQTDDIWHAQSPGKQVFSGDFVLTSDRGNFILSRAIKEERSIEYKIGKKDRAVETAGFRLLLGSMRTLRNSKQEAAKQEVIYCLDKAKLAFPLNLRRWSKGDSFFPLGMKGRKKISDFLTDKKLSRPEKEKTYVLLSQNEIVCVMGHRIDDRYKVTDKTKEIYRIDLIRK